MASKMAEADQGPLTGCETTSFICNYSNSLESIPKAPQTSFLTWRGRANRRKKMKEVGEKFVCKVYKLDSIRSVDEVATYFVFEEMKARGTASD